MGFYARHVLPRAMDWSMRRRGRLRSEILARAHGEVLEIGFGTGLNLPHYPSTVRKLVGVDPMDARPAFMERRIRRAPFPVERFGLRAERGLPFEDGRFDCIVMTWTLCSIAESGPALAEMRRVLRPGGSLLFIEHGRSDDPAVVRWQRRVNGLHRLLALDCRLDRPIDALIRKGGFEIAELDRFVFKGEPRVYGETYRGIARA